MPGGAVPGGGTVVRSARVLGEMGPPCPPYDRFMMSYMTVMQFVKIAAWSNVLLLLGAPIANQLVFMTAAPLISAFRLFYYGELRS